MLQPFPPRLERRLDCRYGFERPLLFSFKMECNSSLGAGQTIELGGGGLLFQSDCPPPDGVAIEVQMAWPFLVQGVRSVVLLIQGTVVRTDARGTAVRMQRYLFQPGDSHAFELASRSGAACNLIG